jgi:hypothetical protein
MGKTIPDQVITAFADKDCTLFRLARFEPVCRDYLEGESNKLFAEAKTWQQGPEIAGYTDRAGRPVPDEHAAYDIAYFPTSQAPADRALAQR